MGKIDFVPNDYVQQRESGRANFLYLILFGILMGAIGVTFSIIKVRQRSVESELANVELRMSTAKNQLTQLDMLKSKSKTMMKTMVVTAELLEPLPRSIILAGLTNNLPAGVSLTELKLEEKEVKVAAASRPAPKAAKGKTPSKASKQSSDQSEKKIYDTLIEIKGVAPSDIEVAGYISKLGSSILMENVELIESKEHKIDEASYREFTLKAKLKRDVQLSKEDIERIRTAKDSTI